MSSLAWASPGDHVGGRARPLQCSGRGQRCGHAPARPVHPPCRPAGRSALLGSRASAWGLAPSATKSRAVSREAKLKEYGDVESVKE
ncbi:hypothetical protein VULLAG_LOCUS20379 [Vulpes lagopus]